MRFHFKLAILALLALAASACQLPVFFPEFVVNTSEPERHRIRGRRRHQRRRRLRRHLAGVTTTRGPGRRFDSLTAPLGGPFPVNAATTVARRRVLDRDGRGGPLRRCLGGRRQHDLGPPLRSRRDAARGGNFPVNSSTPFLIGAPRTSPRIPPATSSSPGPPPARRTPR